jgi:hypothetical protein
MIATVVGIAPAFTADADNGECQIVRCHFHAVRQFDPDIVSITLGSSPMRLSSGDEVPHIFTRPVFS